MIADIFDFFLPRMNRMRTDTDVHIRFIRGKNSRLQFVYFPQIH